jgi:HD-like signal output (HDOD) protein
VFVVDDQPSALKAVVLLMETLGPGWNVSGFANPMEAVAALKKQVPDLVLSDFNMPEMMGSELLEVVRESAPNAVRIIMSGWVDLTKLSKITSAHQYFTKPFDAVRLKELIRRTFAARESIQDEDLRQLVASLRSLPSLPHVYHTLLSRLDDDDRPSDAIAGLVAHDAGLSSKLLHLANSPLFGRGQHVSDPFDAVLCLGTELIKAVVLSQELFKHYALLKHSDVDVSRLWSHCWDVAELGQYICHQTKGSSSQCEAAFLAGLLHEIGLVILLDNFPQQFGAACDIARKKRSPLSSELIETFEASPPQVAAYLLELWGMPAEVVNAVALHEHPERDSRGQSPLSTVVYTADQISARRAPPHAFAMPDWNVDYLKTLGWWDRIPAWEQA